MLPSPAPPPVLASRRVVCYTSYMTLKEYDAVIEHYRAEATVSRWPGDSSRAYEAETLLRLLNNRAELVANGTLT